MANNILAIAATLKKIYKEVFTVSPVEETDLDEMKMHKLLYFAQKRHFSNFGEWLFNEDFEGWVHGPVKPKNRSAFSNINLYLEDISLEEEYTIREIVYEYGKFDSWFLRNLSHEDQAYQISRDGLSEYELGDRIIQKDHIMIDLSKVSDDDFREYEHEVRH